MRVLVLIDQREVVGKGLHHLGFWMVERHWVPPAHGRPVRLIRFTAAWRAFRAQRITLVTALLEAELYPAADVIALHLRRWRIEFCPIGCLVEREVVGCLTQSLVGDSVHPLYHSVDIRKFEIHRVADE